MSDEGATLPVINLTNEDGTDIWAWSTKNAKGVNDFTAFLRCGGYRFDSREKKSRLVAALEHMEEEGEPKRPDEAGIGPITNVKAITSQLGGEELSWDGTVEIKVNNRDQEKVQTTEARANVSLCNSGRMISATFRTIRPLVHPSAGSHDDKHPFVIRRERGEYLFEATEYAQLICDATRLKTLHTPYDVKDSYAERPSGLLVISGSTNSSKSLIVTSIVKLLLERLTADEHERTPHLVTFEDPIEGMWKTKLVGAETSVDLREFEHDSNSVLNATFRQLRIDVLTLTKAFEDAKRQTPAIFMVGEVRDREEWKEIVNFGKSGHFVIATTHADSLRDTASNILLGCKAKTPAARRECFKAVRGIAHLAPSDLGGDLVDEINVDLNPQRQKKFNQRYVLPTVWRGGPQELNSLVSVGLSSISPSGKSTVSRSDAAMRLLESAGVRGDRSWDKSIDVDEIVNTTRLDKTTLTTLREQMSPHGFSKQIATAIDEAVVASARKADLKSLIGI